MLHISAQRLRAMKRLTGTRQLCEFRSKSWKDVWLGDSGYHPIVMVIGFSICLPIVFLTYRSMVRTDKRVKKDMPLTPAEMEATVEAPEPTPKK